MIEVLHGGVLSSIQDRGRYGYRQYGVPISGAMDGYALRMANILVGNPEDVAGIEVTFYGLKLRSTRDIWIAITGGDLSPQMNGESIPLWTSTLLKKDNVLAFGRLKSGLRAYVGVQGGIDLPLLMNSRSTMIKAAFGGTGGPLKSGDRLKIGGNFLLQKTGVKTLPERYVPEYKTQNELRVVLGPQFDYFAEETFKLFLDSEYTVAPESDRQGYRLKGPELKHIKSFNLITEAVWPGVVQVPGDGLPILLLADAQTTGGYPKIASVISVDLDRIGQAKPSDKIWFQAVSLEKAQNIFLEQEEHVLEIKKILWK